MPSATRATQTFETGGGRKLVLRDYITGAEYREIRSIYVHALSNKEGADLAQATYDADNKAIELTVVELDGSVETILDRVLALPLADYQEVIEQVSSRVEVKKKSGTV